MGKMPLPLFIIHTIAVLLIAFAAILTHIYQLWIGLILYLLWILYKLFKPGDRNV